MVAPSPVEVASGYDQGAIGYDARHSDARLQRKYRRIERSMRTLLGRGRVLDLGCGTGRLLEQVPARRGVGIDVSLAMLKQANAGLATACGDAHRLPFAGASFDVVIAAQGVVRYFDLPRAFLEVARVLRPGGCFAAHQFGDVFSLRRFTRDESPMSLQNPSELTQPAAAAGLRPTSIELWRPIPVYPYAVRVPAPLPGRLWTHCVVLFEKTLNHGAGPQGAG